MSGADKVLNVVIAVDGPSGAGKSTVSRMLAERLGLTYIDTGAMYRAVALKAFKEGAAVEDPAALSDLAARCDIAFKKVGDDNHTFLDGQDVSDQIREPEVTRLSSVVASQPAVREILVSLQRKIGAAGGVIMDGRDVGTVVFPKADVKFFLDASLAVRGRRRHVELQSQKGFRGDEETVREEMARRDEADATRRESPLKQAEDALYLDTSSMNPEDVVAKMEEIIRSSIKKGKDRR